MTDVPNTTKQRSQIEANEAKIKKGGKYEKDFSRGYNCSLGGYANNRLTGFSRCRDTCDFLGLSSIWHGWQPNNH
jgi:hypothetical protein